MFTLAMIISALIIPAFLRPQEPAPIAATIPSSKTGGESTQIPIVRQSADSSPDGNFNFSYETGNGIKVDEKGYLKIGQNASEQVQVIEGNVSYTDSTGAVINLRYIADENGYQPTGDHLPVAPPVPEYIAKSLNLTARSDKSAQLPERLESDVAPAPAASVSPDTTVVAVA